MTSTLTRPAQKAAARRDHYQEITDNIVGVLETGVVPWHRPWSRTNGPTRMSNGKPYRGINIFLLGSEAMAQGYESKWWGTYNEIQKRGGQVRRKQKSTQVIYWNLLDKKDAAGDVVGKIPMLRFFPVFNADQADGLDLDEGLVHDHDTVESCEAIRDSYLSRALGLTLNHGGDRAAYSPSLDTVFMPTLNSFDTAEHYYGVLFHEFAHSTGHETRLNRGNCFGNSFGTPDYSKEELVAEMTAAFVCGEAGIEVNVPNRAAYIDSWLTVLKNDKKLLVSAGGQAQKAADLILGPEAEEDEA